MNGYFAVQLDKQSCNVVKKLATKDVLVSDHVTLAYKPIKKVYDKYSKSTLVCILVYDKYSTRASRSNTGTRTQCRR